MATRYSFAIGLIFGAICLAPSETFGQCVDGVCRQPVRKVIQAMRPVNWPIWQHSHQHTYQAPSNCSTYYAPTVVASETISYPPAPTVIPFAAAAETLPSGTATATASSTVESQGISDRIAFRRSLIAVARKARQDNDISITEFLLIAGASRNPVTCDRLMASVHEAAIEEGLASTQAIDWNAIADFLERILPIIIKLIEMFGYIPNGSWQYA